MHAIRKQRLQWVIFTLVASSTAIGLVVYTLGQNINYFYTPSQIARGEAPLGVPVRAGGMVVRGSLERDSESLDVVFDVSDGVAQLRVEYSGILPDLFGEGQAAIVAGVVDAGVVDALGVDNDLFFRSFALAILSTFAAFDFVAAARGSAFGLDCDA